ncbi:hypothetical protein A2U01_0072239, partial [Trifolium medium]|nr:hypothetical protein [Trifolium medium]
SVVGAARSGLGAMCRRVLSWASWYLLEARRAAEHGATRVRAVYMDLF